MLELISSALTVSWLIILVWTAHRDAKVMRMLKAMLFRRLARGVDAAIKRAATAPLDRLVDEGIISTAQYIDLVGVPDEGSWQDPVSEAEIHALASEMAAQANESVDTSRDLYREIIDRGGISRHSNDLEEEYNEIPKHYRRVDGLPADEMASELGMTERQLMAEICAAERTRTELPVEHGKRIRRFRVRDFIHDAESSLIDQRRSYADAVPF